MWIVQDVGVHRLGDGCCCRVEFSEGLKDVPNDRCNDAFGRTRNTLSPSRYVRFSACPTGFDVVGYVAIWISPYFLIEGRPKLAGRAIASGVSALVTEVGSFAIMALVPAPLDTGPLVVGPEQSLDWGDDTARVQALLETKLEKEEIATRDTRWRRGSQKVAYMESWRVIEKVRSVACSPGGKSFDRKITPNLHTQKAPYM